MAKTVIQASKVGKFYNLSHTDRYYDLRDLIMDSPKKIWDRIKNRKKKRKDDFWALKDVSFSVLQGEVLGVIGRNGAGKSTLLKILARIVPPTTGKITIDGRVASILEVGTGFNSELTGRENVYLSGSILGMKRSEIDRKFKKIVEFSEIDRFIDMPVKRYSSGMYVRLAFAIVVHLDPEILIIDEVLAVGDLAFQRKSLKKMRSIAKDEGRTVLFVSHNMTAVDSLCDRAILLEEGRLVAVGKTRDVIGKYMSDYVPDENESTVGKLTNRIGNGKIRIENFWLENALGQRISQVKTGDKCRFVFKYLAPSGESQKDIDVGFGVTSPMEQSLFIHYMDYTKQELTKCPPRGKFVFECPKLPLAKGQYKMSVRVTVEREEADFVVGAINFNVEDGDFYHTGETVMQKHSPMYVDGSWQLEK